MNIRVLIDEIKSYKACDIKNYYVFWKTLLVVLEIESCKGECTS